LAEPPLSLGYIGKMARFQTEPSFTTQHLARLSTSLLT
jgi:hypothetical protein